jgi:hypothetical protein
MTLIYTIRDDVACEEIGFSSKEERAKYIDFIVEELARNKDTFEEHKDYELYEVAVFNNAIEAWNN